MDASLIPKGKSAERPGDGRAHSEPGIYVHKDTGAEFITAPGEEGVIQADQLLNPLWKDAWERKGDVPSRLELLARRKAQEVKDAKAEAEQKKADEAELKAAVGEDAKLPEGGEVYEPKLAEAVK